MRFLPILLAFSFFFSCQGNAPEKRSDSTARAVCSCTAKLLELNKQAAASTGAIDFEGIQRAFDEARTCIALQKIKPEEVPELEKALEVLCPELAKEQELLAELVGD